MAEAPNTAEESAEPKADEAPPTTNGKAAYAGGQAAPTPKPKSSTGAGSSDEPFAAVEKLANVAPGLTTAMTPAMLGKRIKILPGQPLPELDTPSAKAYVAEDQREPARPLYALICTPGLPVRTEVMRELKNVTVHGLIPLVEFGPVDWALLNQRCMAVIFERPLGGSLADAFKDGPVKVNEYELGERVVDPISHAIATLKDMGISHRSVCVENLYFMDKERRELVLGECVTAPSAFNLPPIYETAQRAMAMPHGRGIGTVMDDLYSIGVLMVLLLFGKNPVEDLSENEVIIKKLEQGSYQTFVGDVRLPLQLIEPLRGLLSDDAAERWDGTALEIWLSGQKKTPMQKRPVQKPRTSFKFAGHMHVSPRSLALSLNENVAEAATLIKNGKISLWMKQSMMMASVADEIDHIVASAKLHEGKADGEDDVIVAKTCIRLDPAGPIRFKGFSFMIDGFGPALAVEYLRKGNFQLPSEMLARDLAGYWFSAQESLISDATSYDKTFTTLRSFFMIKEMGFGIERCLYETNRSLPCQSEILQKVYIDHVEDLLTGLDEVASETDTQTRPMDKHIAAYIATHFKFDVSPHLKALSDEKPETSLVGLLSLYALMQWRLKNQALYGLGRWLGGLLTPAIGSYHSQSTRSSIEREIPTLVRQGSLPELFDLIDNADRRHQDETDFEDAQAEFAHSDGEIQNIVGDEEELKTSALLSGERATAVTSIVMGMAAISIILILQSV